MTPCLTRALRYRGLSCNAVLKHQPKFKHGASGDPARSALIPSTCVASANNSSFIKVCSSRVGLWCVCPSPCKNAVLCSAVYLTAYQSSTAPFTGSPATAIGPCSPAQLPCDSRAKGRETDSCLTQCGHCCPEARGIYHGSRRRQRSQAGGRGGGQGEGH